jgi:cell division protein ZapA
MLNKVKVSILGKDYTLQTEESPNYVYGLARQLEASIRGNMEKGASQYTAAIMAALSALDDLNQEKRRLDQTADMTKDYVDDAGRARIERDAALKEIEALRSKIAQLENTMKLRKLGESL